MLFRFVLMLFILARLIEEKEREREEYFSCIRAFSLVQEIFLLFFIIYLHYNAREELKSLTLDE